MGDLSPHFSRAEFTCHHCGTLPAGGVPTALVHGLEALRALAYPDGLMIESGYRCAAYNATLAHAATGSQHLYAAAADIPLRAELGSVQALHAFSGIGWQAAGRRRLVRHVDVRHASGHDPTASTTAHPATWEYLADGSRR